MTAGGWMYIVYQVMASLSLGMSGMVSSLTMGYTSPALPSMKKDTNFTLTEDDGSWIGSVMPACALIGSLGGGPMLDTFGRRATLMFLTWPFMISWAIIALSSNVTGVILGRMLGGACVGVQTVAASVFMPETVQLDLRNKLFIFPAVLGTLGILVSYAAGQFLSWRELAWLGCLLCLPQAVLLFPLPETPYFLTKSGKRESSLAALNQLRQTPQEAEKEQDELDESCRSKSDAKETTTDWTEMFRPPNLWPVAVGSALMVAQQTTGINAVIFYSSSVFEAGGDILDPNTGSTLLGVVNVLGVFVSGYLAATRQRRYLLALSTVALVTSLSLLSAFFWAREAGGMLSSLAENLSFIPVVALLAYMFGFSLGWGPVPWIFLAEGMPSSVRGLAVAFIVAINWGSAFLVTKTFQLGIALLGIHYTFLTYAVVTGIGALFIHRSMPETFSLSSAQMDKMYLEESKLKKQ